jgi:hypothetical protein
MIKKRLINEEKTNEHIIIYANEPCRIEICGKFVVHGR